jgi:murein DD-endopeptidase MepM/ murein hydrolase activator NlpD
MGPALRVLAGVLAVLAALAAAPAARAEADPGGAAAGAPLTGGAAFREPGAPPVVELLRLSPATVVEGRALPKVAVRVDGPLRALVRVSVLERGTRRTAARLPARRATSGRVLRVRLPARLRLAAGRYAVRVEARASARAVATVRRATLVVQPRPAPPAPPPPPPAPPAPAPPPPPAAPVAVRPGVFPVLGPSTFGGDGSRFGADRGTHAHQGQDVAAPEGAVVVAPYAATVVTTAFQAGAAGRYLVLACDDGRAWFLAHLQEGSVAVGPGARVAAGQPVARVGATGSASGPHLHLEIWAPGWRTPGSAPIDPLPVLLALQSSPAAR